MDDNLSFYEHGDEGRAVTLLNVPLELGSDARGLAATPAYLKANGLEKMFACIGREVAHTVTLSCPKPPMEVGAGSMKNAKEIVSVAKRAKLAVQRAAKRGDTVVALGGDHATAIGTIAGAAAAYPSLGLIYIDAHPDCTTDETTLSGNVHGMVVSTQMGEGNPLLTDIISRQLEPQNIVYIGIKDPDQAEIDFIRKHGIRTFTMLDIAHGLAPVFSAIASLAHRVDSLWISMDLDSIDEEYAPAVAMSTSGGLTRREVLSLAHYIGKIANVAGVDIVEILPAKDKDGKTAGLALELTARFLGSEYSWYTEYMREYRETNIANEEQKVPIKRSSKQ
jgi:arginase